ncbi:MAG: VOC family protein [Cyclobacteriaceae bacterium]|jgi:PhnB protein|nr:VOC family protein [Cyclobacteriaceae bacterium]
MTLQAHLTFNGNCRQALAFYQKCLGGTLTLQTVGESPRSSRLPETMKNLIVQGTLRTDSFTLCGTDLPADTGLVKGNAVSLVLRCATPREAHLRYRQLSQTGRRARFASHARGVPLTDRFGVPWLVVVQGIASRPR